MIRFPSLPTDNPTDWGGKISQADLLAEAKRLRLAHWKIQQEAGVDSIPSGDFALYDHVLNQIQDFGVWPSPFALASWDLKLADSYPIGRSRAVHQGWP